WMRTLPTVSRHWKVPVASRMIEEASTTFPTKISIKPMDSAAVRISGDFSVVGAGISGISAALEAARLGRKVILVDGQPSLGGQAVNSIIGTFCGLFSNGTHGYQFTRGIADDILEPLGK